MEPKKHVTPYIGKPVVSASYVAYIFPSQGFPTIWNAWESNKFGFDDQKRNDYKKGCESFAWYELGITIILNTTLTHAGLDIESQ